jgi:hypothetical protein
MGSLGAIKEPTMKEALMAGGTMAGIAVLLFLASEVVLLITVGHTAWV